MNPVKDALDREARRIDARPGALDAVLHLRDARRRERRLATAVVAVGLSFAVVALFIGSLARERSLPADHPRSGLPRNGAIAVRATTGAGGAILQIDPATGAVSELPVVATPEELTWPGRKPVDLSWSPDGTSLAYNLGRDLEILDIASGESRRISTSCARPCEIAWSPDGSAIAIAQGDRLELIDPESAQTTTLSTFRGRSVTNPTWAPDATQIAVAVTSTSGSRLYVVDRSSSAVTVIEEVAPSDGFSIWMPTWSPDGTTIAYLSWDASSADPDGAARLAVTVISQDGSSSEVLARTGRCFCVGFTPGISWSPDGSRLALVVPGIDSDVDGLYVMKADGSGVRLIREGAWGRPAWQPIP